MTLIDADREEPNCMVCINQDKCYGKWCGPKYGWLNYARYEDDIQINMDTQGESDEH